jgi:hypothetical protein
MILGICASIIPFPDHNQVSNSIFCVRDISTICANHYCSRRVIPINLLWVSKQWEFSLRISTSAWTRWQIFSTTLKNPLQRPAPWSS